MHDLTRAARRRLLAALEAARQAVCVYPPGGTCDCKEGLLPLAGRATTRLGTEATGCPELRTLIHRVRHLPTGLFRSGLCELGVDGCVSDGCRCACHDDVDADDVIRDLGSLADRTHRFVTGARGNCAVCGGSRRDAAHPEAHRG